jgi:hypothetical protein
MAVSLLPAAVTNMSSALGFVAKSNEYFNQVQLIKEIVNAS